MKTIIITPPIYQFNSPYPSGAYLCDFFKSLNCESSWFDLNNDFFYSIFSKKGLNKLFELSKQKTLNLIEQSEQNHDEETAFNLRRFLNTKDLWCNWIDFITSVLCENQSISTREKSHQFLNSPFAPRGSRMENYLQNLQYNPTIDDIRFLCTFALVDLSDFINVCFDSQFSLIRYAENLVTDTRDFSEIENALNSPILEHFYKPILEEKFSSFQNNSATLILISVPFAGTLIPSLFTARFIKKKFNNNVFICIGGGFINTELRQIKTKSLSKYVDAVSYDRGYGSYKMLFDSHFLENQNIKLNPIYKMMIFTQNQIIFPKWNDEFYQDYENKITTKIMPDFSDINFSKYPRLCDDINAMHRIWTDGTWIKTYLAHGCYWHKCAFCDTTLDYVCGYKICDVEKLFYHLLKTCKQKGIFGIHFVDEALPPFALKKFALLNAQNDNSLYFWGNIRFEKTFTKDFAAFLCFCGLGAVSAGLEIATGNGLKNIEKGIEIQSIVNSCAAFKEAGILIHAYMIYGFWNDTAQTIIDSMETLRQLFEIGLLDSAFWHKFVLTKNSTVLNKWKKDKNSINELEPIFNDDNNSFLDNNNIHFKGENKFDKFGDSLEIALNKWMNGKSLNKKIQSFFDFPVPKPTIKNNYIEELIEYYEKENQKNHHNYDFSCSKKELYWIGSDFSRLNKKITWMYLQEEFFIENSYLKNVNLIIEVLENLSPKKNKNERKNILKKIEQNIFLNDELKLFFDKGLVLV